MNTVYQARSIKRKRRTKREMDELRRVIYEAVEEDCPMTVRQVYYRLVVLGVIEKTENQYDAVVEQLKKMRLNGEIPFDWIDDGTRRMRKPTTHSNLRQALHRWMETYRRSHWDSQDDHVQIWLEKDALTGVLYQVTSEYDVPLMVTRGYSSISFLHDAATAIIREDKPTYVYQFGDHDPSGVDILRALSAGLERHAPEAEIHYERVAVTPDQIVEWDLPTRLTKKSDTRAKNFKGDSVEVDAIPPRNLRDMARECIAHHLDHGVLEMSMRAEQAERDMLREVEERLVS